MNPDKIYIKKIEKMNSELQEKYEAAFGECEEMKHHLSVYKAVLINRMRTLVDESKRKVNAAYKIKVIPNSNDNVTVSKVLLDSFLTCFDNVIENMESETRELKNKYKELEPKTKKGKQK